MKKFMALTGIITPLTARPLPRPKGSRSRSAAVRQAHRTGPERSTTRLSSPKSGRRPRRSRLGGRGERSGCECCHQLYFIPFQPAKLRWFFTGSWYNRWAFSCRLRELMVNNMQTLNITVSDELADQLQPYQEYLDTLLLAGLREAKLGQSLALFKQGHSSV